MIISKHAMDLKLFFFPISVYGILYVCVCVYHRERDRDRQRQTQRRGREREREVCVCIYVCMYILDAVETWVIELHQAFVIFIFLCQALLKVSQVRCGHLWLYLFQNTVDIWNPEWDCLPASVLTSACIFGDFEVWGSWSTFFSWQLSTVRNSWATGASYLYIRES